VRDRCDQDRDRYRYYYTQLQIQIHLAATTADSRQQQHQVKPQTSDRNSTTVSHQTVEPEQKPGNLDRETETGGGAG